MTEAEWLAATDPEQLVRSLLGRASERKLRLFTLACCDRVQPLITDPRSTAALAFAWEYVETTPNRKGGRPKIAQAAKAAHIEAYNRFVGMTDLIEKYRQLARSTAADAARLTLDADPMWAAEYVAAFAAIAIGWEWVIANKPELLPTYSAEHRIPEHAAQLPLLRCIFGNPFRPVVFVPSWRTETAVALAAGIYEERAFDRLPILADALEEAGCDHADVLNHLRGPGPHARGCWVVDGVLGKA
jgi:hypothetical protein